jgi:beta-glucosidase
MTFPKSLAQTPTHAPDQYPGTFADGSTTRPAGDNTSVRQVEYTEGLKVGYRWYQSQHQKPLFPFGYGLSYSRFAYSHLEVAVANHKNRPSIVATFRLSNTSRTAGTEVAQLYLTLPSPAREPAARLAGWQRVTLGARQSRTVSVTLGARTIATRHLMEYWDAARSQWRAPTGTYRVRVGPSSATGLTSPLRLK